jgi:membrane protein DedA with SNARE-associated domain
MRTHLIIPYIILVLGTGYAFADQIRHHHTGYAVMEGLLCLFGIVILVAIYKSKTKKNPL